MKGGVVGVGRAQDRVAPCAGAVDGTELEVLGQPAESGALAAVGFGVRQGAAPLGDGEAGEKGGDGEEVGDVGCLFRGGGEG